MFVVLAATAVPEHLRGYMTRFLLEVRPGIYVGNLSARVADRMWDRAERAAGTGELTLIQQDHEREQGYSIRTTPSLTHRAIDLDGLTLFTRPEQPDAPSQLHK